MVRITDPKQGRAFWGLGGVAEGLGAADLHALTSEALKRALDEARNEKRMCVIVCVTDPHRFLPDSEVWWDATPAEVSGDAVLQSIRLAYEQDRHAAQRCHY
jgi:3D-(3,5/4)-trihydroxycyclohexane-1,2-dione acylhydrolase (decyclizing)